MKPLTHLLHLLCFAAVLIYASPVQADPQIDVNFETGMTGGQKLVHARAVFPAREALVFDVFNSIESYPLLHQWIERATVVRAGRDVREFRVDFAFPWPVGRKWSRVRVRYSDNTIFWKQLDGTLEANEGRIRFTPDGDQVQLDYRAAIDIGLPELWTRRYKETFIRQFLTAACKKAETVGSALASSKTP